MKNKNGQLHLYIMRGSRGSGIGGRRSGPPPLPPWKIQVYFYNDRLLSEANDTFRVIERDR